MKNYQQFLKEMNYAYENVPFYRDKLDEMNVSPSQIKGESDIQKLPFTAKQDYRKNFPKGVLAKGFPLNHPMLTRSQSSGTTGERLITFEIGMLLLQRAMSCVQTNTYLAKVFSKKGRKICRYAAPNCSDVECANPNSTMEDRLLSDGTLVLPVYHDLLTTSEELINRAIDEILTYQPDLFYVDPTHFAFLLREFKKRKISPPEIPVVTSYSAVTQVSRRQIAEFFPLETHFSELVSSSEMGWFALLCPKGKLHLNESSFYFEFVNLQGEMAEEGEISELCISSIDQGALPHLRYKTGDMVRFYNTLCQCGSQGKVINMEGRLGSFLYHNGEAKISPREVDLVIGAPDWLDLYQLEQIQNDEFVLKMIVNENFHEDESKNTAKSIEELISERMEYSTRVKIEVMDYIPSGRSGKFQTIKINENV